MIFQPTLPARGATRDGIVITEGAHISTHAPRTGSDWLRHPTKPEMTDFNPRSPHGERHYSALPIVPLYAFQPTLPARGATRNVRRAESAERISTHAPRTGSDCTSAATPLRNPHFNPRSPHGERQSCGRGKRMPKEISTHAPRTGSDQRSHRMRTATQNFNPRSPHGERPSSACPSGTNKRFQPTLPARGATEYTEKYAAFINIFQPTLPARGATAFSFRALWRMAISTHAPRTGSDCAWTI